MSRELLLEWDESALIDEQVECIIDNIDEYPEHVDKSKDDIRESIYNDHFYMEYEYETLCQMLTDIMIKKNYRNYYRDMWYVTVEHFGWRGISGDAVICADNGADLLSKILPDTDCTFKIFDYGRTGFKIQNFHHDSPSGREWYYVRPMTIDEVNDQNGDWRQV